MLRLWLWDFSSFPARSFSSTSTSTVGNKRKVSHFLFTVVVVTVVIIKSESSDGAALWGWLAHPAVDSALLTASQALNFQYLSGRTAQTFRIKRPGRNSLLQTRRLSRLQQTNFAQASRVNSLPPSDCRGSVSNLSSVFFFFLFLGFTVFRRKEMENYLHELNNIFVFIVSCGSEEKDGGKMERGLWAFRRCVSCVAADQAVRVGLALKIRMLTCEQGHKEGNWFSSGATISNIQYGQFQSESQSSPASA